MQPSVFKIKSADLCHAGQTDASGSAVIAAIAAIVIIDSSFVRAVFRACIASVVGGFTELGLSQRYHEECCYDFAIISDGDQFH